MVSCDKWLDIGSPLSEIRNIPRSKYNEQSRSRCRQRRRIILLLMSNLLTPEAIRMVKAIAEHGSMAGAARALGLVPSALTYRLRQVEEALDVLLFDRSNRQARLTAAGMELLSEGQRVLEELDSVANRVRRVATGWEPQLTIAVDGIISRSIVIELVEQFLALGAPTRLRLRDETLSGTWHCLTDGIADLAIGVVVDTSIAGIKAKPMGDVQFLLL